MLTGAVAHFRDDQWPVGTLPLGLTLGLGRDALGLSHLTLDLLTTVRTHISDHPPFPC